MDAAREVGRRALALAKEDGEPTAVAIAALAFAGRLPGFGAIVCDEEVVAELEQALALLPGSAIAPRAQVMARPAEELAYSPRRGVERALGPQAIELARRVGDPGVLSAVLRTTQWSVWTPDDVERRRALADEIVALARPTGDRVLGLDGELLRLWSALERGEMDVAWHQLATCARLVEELRLPYYAWVTAAARACLHIGSGRLDEAEALAERAQHIGERSGDLTVAFFGGVQREHVKFLRGRFDEVAEWLAGVLRSFPVLVPAVECSLVVTYGQSGQHERCRSELARYWTDDFAAVPRNAMWLMNMAFLADAAVSIGDAEAAAHLYPHLAPLTPYNVVLPPAFVLGPVSHYIAGLAALMGNEAAARRHYEDALALETRTGTRQWTARTQLEYGRFLLRSRTGDRERGARLVGSARALAEELGLAPIVALADATELPAAPRPPIDRACRFRRNGDEWELEFLGRAAIIRHRVGMDYLRSPRAPGRAGAGSTSRARRSQCRRAGGGRRSIDGRSRRCSDGSRRSKRTSTRSRSGARCRAKRCAPSSRSVGPTSRRAGRGSRRRSIARARRSRRRSTVRSARSRTCMTRWAIISPGMSRPVARASTSRISPRRSPSSSKEKRRTDGTLCHRLVTPSGQRDATVLRIARGQSCGHGSTAKFGNGSISFCCSGRVRSA
jgi:hypothetical protein